MHRDIFRGPCIVIYSEDRASCYIQRTVHRDIFRGPCIVLYSEDRASWYIQRIVHRDKIRGPCIVIYSEDRASWYIVVTNPTKYTNFSNLFWNSTLHVSDRFSAHHQESSPVYKAVSICHTGYADCLLASSQHNLHTFCYFYRPIDWVSQSVIQSVSQPANQSVSQSAI